MINYFLHYIEFGLICVALTVIAFRPAWQEWRRPTDQLPLPVDPVYSVDIDFFAEKFRRQALAFLGNQRAGDDPEFTVLSDAIESLEWHRLKRAVLAGQSLSSHVDIDCPVSVYVDGNVDFQARNRLTALYAEGAVHLGPASEIGDWVHARGELSLGAASTATCRISSTTAIDLADECAFERIYAPVIRFGQRLDQARAWASQPLQQTSFASLPEAVRRTELLYLVNGDCVIPPGGIYHQSLIVTGTLTVGKGTRIYGDVKAREGITLEADVEVIGALISEGAIHIQDHVRIKGPLVSEASIVIGSNSTVGAIDGLTSISAEEIIVAPGVIAHGSVWATKIGMVWQS